MPVRRATTVQQWQKIARFVAAGWTYDMIADQVEGANWAGRTWTRRAQTRGVHSLVTVPGRPRTGALRSGAPVVRYVVLRRNVPHPTWDAA